MTHRITRSVSTRRLSANLTLEALEQRELMAIDVIWDPGYHNVAGTVEIEGTSGKDRVVLTVDTKVQSNPYDDKLVITTKYANNAVQTYRFSLWQKSDFNNQYYPALRLITFKGDYGDDYFENQSAINCWASGGPGTDFLSGGSGIDTLRGDSGTDTLMGNNGDDTLDGGTGVDFLFGGANADHLYGGNDNERDLLNGGSGKDTFASPLMLIDLLDDYNANQGDRVEFV